MYKTFIVDDEIFQQETLLRMMEDYKSSYQVEAVCSSVDEGIKKIKELKPQLVFLDVMLPPKTGFDLLQEIGERNFEVIFTTSYDTFALKAFKVSAVDYLLKPFSKEELRAALDKFEKKLAGTQPLNHIEILLENISSTQARDARIALPTINGFVFVKAGDVIRCESEDTYSTFYFTNQKPMVVSKSLKDCEEILDERLFCRVHTSHIINMNFIKEYIRGDGGTVIMTDGSHVDISRRRKEDFLSRLSMR